MDRKKLKEAFESGLIDETKYKDELFKLETSDKPNKKEKRIYEKVTEKEVMDAISYIKSPKIVSAIILAYGSGLRLQEILNLQPDDIRVAERKVFIRQGKGAKDRPTILSKKFKSDWVKLYPLGLTKMAIQKSFHEASIEAGFNRPIYEFDAGGKQRKKYRLHFHCLRHSFATNLLEKGVPINQVQLLMGHVNLATTSNYVRANATEAIASAIKSGV